MKKALVVFMVFALTFVSCLGINAFCEKNLPVNSKALKNSRAVVLDAGHGGKDSGTVAADGTLEKDINLKIVLNLYDFLMFSGIDCYTIRNDDTECYPPGSNTNRSDLYNRLDYVNSIDNSMLVSIHQNHFVDTSEWGLQVWYTANEKSSESLADGILDISKQFLQPDNKRLSKESDNSYYILYKAKVPSVMVECGFMSNVEENAKLKSDEYQKQLSYVILMGINKYLTEDINNG